MPPHPAAMSAGPPNYLGRKRPMSKTKVALLAVLAVLVAVLVANLALLGFLMGQVSHLALADHIRPFEAQQGGCPFSAPVSTPIPVCAVVEAATAVPPCECPVPTVTPTPKGTPPPPPPPPPTPTPPPPPEKERCNRGIGNLEEGCDPGNSFGQGKGDGRPAGEDRHESEGPPGNQHESHGGPHNR